MNGKATYIHKVTGQTYQLGFEIPDGQTELERAWDLVCGTVSHMTGWHFADIRVIAGK